MTRALISIWLVFITCMFVHANTETGDSWLRVDDAVGEKFTSVEWNGPLAVAVGSRGMLCTSREGKLWINRNAATSASLRKVLWNGSQYIAVGDGGTVIRSGDGIHWQRVNTPLSESLVGVAWTGTQFVALSNSASIITSNDGVIWSMFGKVQADNVVAVLPNGIYHFDGAYYVRSSSNILRSLDLVVWTSVRDLPNNPASFPMKKLNGRLYVTGSLNQIQYSTDGITWTPANVVAPTIPTFDIYDITFRDGVFVAVGSSSSIYVSTDGHNWTRRSGPTDRLDAVVWKNGEFIAVGSNRSIATSSNGVEWTSQVKDTNTYAMSSIVLNGSHFIGVGRYGRLMTSPDFEQWTTRHSQTISNLSSVVWTGSFAIASGEGGVILRSVDGLSWNQVPVLTSQSNHRLVWTGSTVFSVGSSGVYQSTDGMEWVQISTTILNFDDVTWTGTQFVGVGFNGAIFTSPTGVEWMQRASGTTAVLNAVKSAGGRIMAGGQGNTILQSTNGSDWTSIPFPNGTIEAIDYRFGKWIVATVAGIYSSVDGSAWQPFSGVSQGVESLYSGEMVWNGNALFATGINASTSDGHNWTRFPFHPTAPTYKAVGKSATGWVAVGTGGAIVFSHDGYCWNVVNRVTSLELNDVTRGQNAWIAVGAGGVILRSADGVNWTMVSSGTTEVLHEVVWNGAMFAAAGVGGTILVSSDGIHWTKKSADYTGSITNLIAAGTNFHAFLQSGTSLSSAGGDVWSKYVAPSMADIAWVGTHYVATATSGWIYQSSADGRQWTRMSSGTNAYLTGICWTGSLIVAVGGSGTIITSPDGSSWTPRASGTSSWIQSIVWNGNQLVAVGNSGVILTSPDGVTWTARASGITSHLQKVVWENGIFIAIASDNRGVRSSDGVSWSMIPGASRGGFTVGWIGDRFMSGGTGNISISTVTNTGSWEALSSSLGTTIYDLEWDGLRIFAVGSAGVSILNFSASLWTSTTVHNSPFIDNIVRKGNELLAVGFGETIAISTDGISWKNVSGGRLDALTAVAWNGSHFVGVLGTQVYRSENGSRWDQISAFPLMGGTSRSFRDIIWTDSKFLAVGDLGLLLSSADGREWEVLGNYASNPVGMNAIAGNDSLAVVVGTDGYIAVSQGPNPPFSGFKQWMSDQGAGVNEQCESDDANSDGISNLLAYIHGIPAVGPLTAANRSALPRVSLDPMSGAVVFHFELHESYRANATYFIEVSDDLAADSWETMQERGAGGWRTSSNDPSITESPLPGGGVRIGMSDHSSSSGSRSRFYRMRTAFSQ